jgi:hypothetical protein
VEGFHLSPSLQHYAEEVNHAELIVPSLIRPHLNLGIAFQSINYTRDPLCLLIAYWLEVLYYIVASATRLRFRLCKRIESVLFLRFVFVGLVRIEFRLIEVDFAEACSSLARLLMLLVLGVCCQVEIRGDVWRIFKIVIRRVEVRRNLIQCVDHLVVTCLFAWLRFKLLLNVRRFVSRAIEEVAA